jgi:uncharacterized membrane-anchored protein YhcB (DUF1043 family)
MKELLLSLIAPVCFVIIGAYILRTKWDKKTVSEFDKDLETLKSEINNCNDYYTLHEYKKSLKAMRLKYINMQDFIVDDCTKLLRRLDQKILRCAPKAYKN